MLYRWTTQPNLEGNEVGATISENLISNLPFADDICLVANSNDDVQQLVDASDGQIPIAIGI